MGYLYDGFARKPIYLMAYLLFTAIFAGYVLTGLLAVFIMLRVVHGVAFGTVTVGGNTLVIDLDNPLYFDTAFEGFTNGTATLTIDTVEAVEAEKENARKPSRKKFFIPVRVLSRAFRGKFLDHVKKHFDRSRLKDTASFHAVLNTCYGKDWVVYIKKPMNDAGHVIRYLGRYTHRIAISNARIQGYEDHKVTFTYRDYSDHDRIKTMTLEDTEFLRRFMMHILPARFMKIRHYGFLGNRNREERMKVIRAATKTQEPGPCRIDLEEILSYILKRDVSICIRCGQKRHHKLE